jgi:hypothetical protein
MAMKKGKTTILIVSLIFYCCWIRDGENQDSTAAILLKNSKFHVSLQRRLQSTENFSKIVKRLKHDLLKLNYGCLEPEF